MQSNSTKTKQNRVLHRILRSGLLKFLGLYLTLCISRPTFMSLYIQSLIDTFLEVAGHLLLGFGPSGPLKKKRNSFLTHTHIFIVICDGYHCYRHCASEFLQLLLPPTAVWNTSRSVLFVYINTILCITKATRNMAVTFKEHKIKVLKSKRKIDSFGKLLLLCSYRPSSIGGATAPLAAHF